MKQKIDFLQYLNFCILLFGGGFAYYIVTILIDCPYTETNSKLWSNIFNVLCKVYSGYIIAGAFFTFGKYLGSAPGWIVAFMGLLTGMAWAIHFLFELNKPIRTLLSAKSLQ